MVETVKRNAALGFAPAYKSEWEAESYANADSVYIRPFTYSEGAIGVNVCHEPWVIIVCTTVSAYFSSKAPDAVVTDRVRAVPGGTGSIKTAANYVTSALAKHEAEKGGFIECLFLDGAQHKYIEEGSSCNVFFYLKSGELVTPELGDTILPGITRASLIELARDKGVKVSERKIAIDEVLSETQECFFSGTAAGAMPISSLTYKNKKTVFNNGKVGDLTAGLRDTLKGIQYGALRNNKGWLVKV
jgi:branched-chain amino acid aminotransferase